MPNKEKKKKGKKRCRTPPGSGHSKELPSSKPRCNDRVQLSNDGAQVSSDRGSDIHSLLASTGEYSDENLDDSEGLTQNSTPSSSDEDVVTRIRT